MTKELRSAYDLLMEMSWTGFGERPLAHTAEAGLNARHADLISAVDRLRRAGFPLCAPVLICEWTGDARCGSFVHIDAKTCALHVGRGCYITVDVQRDLNGITPDEALRCTLSRTGIVRQPDTARSYNAA